MSVIVVGASGFVGSAVVDALADAGVDSAALRSPRLEPGAVPADDEWASRVAEVAERLRGARAVVIAGGLAEPDSNDDEALRRANSFMPLLCLRAAQTAKVERVVHVSSAAVQGRRALLDETPETSTFSPYSRSKSEGERLLRQAASESADTALVIYRPTSVQGRDRRVTRSIASLDRLPLVPVAGNGSAPVPLALVENVGAAAAFLTQHPQPPSIAMHPWEGITTGLLMDIFAPSARQVRLPLRMAKLAMALGARVAGSGGVAGLLRRADLLLVGQAIAPTSLERMGFVPPLGVSDYSTLAEHIRKESRT